MNKSKFALATIATLALTTLSVSAEARDRVDRRQNHQNTRVQQGMRSDEITKGEALRLRQSKRAIRHSEHRAEKDGVVTEKESARLEKMQDARSRQINRLKHNDKKDAPPVTDEPVAPMVPDSSGQAL